MPTDKELLELYKNAKTTAEQMSLKKELLKRGFKFKEEDRNSWYMFWTACCLSFVFVLIFAYSPDIKNKIVPKDVKPIVNEDTIVIEDILKSQITELKLQNEELNNKITKLNNRLFGLAITSQENWGRIKKNNKEMVTLDKNWLPDRPVEFMQDSQSLNNKINTMRSEGNVKLEEKK